MNTQRVLLVEDEEAIRLTLSRALQSQGYEVVAVTDGSLALEELARREFDLVLTDLAMERVDGLQVLQEAKRRDRDVCVIVLTGFSGADSAIQALRLGAEDYLNKPFDYDEILLRAGRCLKERRLRRKLRLYEQYLPVCAGCGKLRDANGGEPDCGEWLPLEQCVQRRGDTGVTPGFCPECREHCLQTG